MPAPSRKRGRTTLTYLAVAMLGTDEERAAYREATNTSHRQVRSRPGSAVKYNAFDPELQLWVAACIYRGVVDSLEYLYGPLDADYADELYRESSRFGTTLQMRPEMWPAGRAAFAEYWERRSAQISIDDETVSAGKGCGARTVRARRTGTFPARQPVLHHRLPDPAVPGRTGAAWCPRRQRAFELIMRAIGTVMRLGPERWRMGQASGRYAAPPGAGQTAGPRG
ncbi:oxygenase MpaB family protein [Nocardia sp. NPDC002869]|uniref:oxygenase MpaB family protein n=1 Tax=Nocardia sp. NPDC002869 TaxID=3161032 RepID=UPI00398D10FB